LRRPRPQECTFVPGCQPIGVGRNAVVTKALIDKNVRIGDNVRARSHAALAAPGLNSKTITPQAHLAMWSQPWTGATLAGCSHPDTRSSRPSSDPRRPGPRSPLQVKIVNKDGVREANREEQGYLIKDGIVVIVKNAHILDGTVI
jgi:hypothetical protein